MIDEITDYLAFVNLPKEEQYKKLNIIDFKKIYLMITHSIYYSDMLTHYYENNMKHSKTQMYWNWLNNIKKPPLCPICNKHLKWQKIKHDLSSPYYKTCSSDCGYAYIKKYPNKKQKLFTADEMLTFYNQVEKNKNILDYISFVNLDKKYQMLLQKYVDKILLARNLKHSIYEEEILKTLQEKNLKKYQYYYHWINDIKEIPLCQSCKINLCKWHANSYRKTCGPSCRNNIRFKQNFIHEQSQINKLHTLTNNAYTYIGGYEGSHSKIKVTNKKCGCTFDVIYLNLMYNSNYCIHHREYNSISEGHAKVIDYVKTLIDDKDITINNRKILNGKKELDIYIQKYNFAIEYNGVYYHSYNFGTEINSHYNKSENCDTIGISLLHVYEDQWIHKTDIIKSMISNKLQKNNKVYARKTSIKLLSSSEAKEFFDSSHLAGHTTASIYYGLVYDNKLVCAMSFSKPRFDKKYEWEIIRFSNALFTSVIGGASKLLAHFIKENSPNNIMSYSSNDIGNGELYKSLGFNFLSRLLPGYSYIDKHRIRHSRQKFQKHKLRNMINYDESKTEKQIMMESGYLLIHDAGNKKWELILSNK